jgi:hypothetical protein
MHKNLQHTTILNIRQVSCQAGLASYNLIVHPVLPQKMITVNPPKDEPSTFNGVSTDGSNPVLFNVIPQLWYSGSTGYSSHGHPARPRKKDATVTASKSVSFSHVHIWCDLTFDVKSYYTCIHNRSERCRTGATRQAPQV